MCRPIFFSRMSHKIFKDHCHFNAPLKVIGTHCVFMVISWYKDQKIEDENQQQM